MSEGYNGYHNWDTWSVVLWLSNSGVPYTLAATFGSDEGMLRRLAYKYVVLNRQQYDDWAREIRQYTADGTPTLHGIHAFLLHQRLEDYPVLDEDDVDFDAVDWSEVVDAFTEEDDDE